MNDFDNFHNRTPKRLIFISFALALLLDLMPFGTSAVFWLPEFTALVLLYWTINRPQSIGITAAFITGLLIDIGTAGLLGQHALAYMLMIFTVKKYQRQITLHSYDWQAVAVFFALCGSQFALLIIRLVYHHNLPASAWLGFIAPFVGAFLWPLLNKLMLFVLNFRRLRR